MAQEVRTSLDFKTAFLLDGQSGTTGQTPTKQSNGSIAWQTPSNSGTVTEVTATGPITSSGGTAPVISTSMATNRLLGRSTAGAGVAEEITIGTGLNLSGGTLTATGGGGGTSSAVRIDSSSVANTVYVGKAPTGSAESAAAWTITRFQFSAAGVQTSSSTLSAVTWTGRTSHPYP